MYGAIKTLDKKGWIQEALDDGESLRKKVYIITELERKIAVQELNRLESLYHTAKKIMEGRE